MKKGKHLQQIVVVELEHKNSNRFILITLNKFKSKWIRNFRVKLDTLNLIEEKVRNSLEGIGAEDNFLNKTL